VKDSAPGGTKKLRDTYVKGKTRRVNYDLEMKPSAKGLGGGVNKLMGESWMMFKNL